MKNYISIKGIIRQDIIIMNIPILQYNLKIQWHRCGKKLVNQLSSFQTFSIIFLEWSKEKGFCFLGLVLFFWKTTDGKIAKNEWISHDHSVHCLTNESAPIAFPSGEGVAIATDEESRFSTPFRPLPSQATTPKARHKLQKGDRSKRGTVSDRWQRY